MEKAGKLFAEKNNAAEKYLWSVLDKAMQK